MLDVDITDKDLDNAIRVINASDNAIFQPAFKRAGSRIVEGVVHDLRGGVASISGELQSSIIGKLMQVQGAEVDFQLTGSVMGRYDYGGRLDKDGGMTWRSGRFAGRKTFGWFSYQTRKRSGSVYKISRRELRRAVAEIINEFVSKFRQGGGG